MLPGYFTEEVVVDNHAMNGRSSLSFINEGRWDVVLSKIHKGDYVFIQFGHNDEKPRATLHTEPGSTFDDNLRRFVNETRAKGGNPVLFNSIVRRNFPPKGVTEIKGSYEKEGPVLVDTHGEYLESPRRVAGEMNVPFIDLNKLTHDLVTGMGVENSRKLFMWIPAGQYEFCPEGKIDNTHLNIYGGRIVAGLVVDALMEEVPALAKYVRRYDYVVAKDGSGDFFTVQEAVNAAVGGGKLLKQLIAGFQAGLPVEVYPRELMLPVDSNKIITVPGVRRCGKSSLFLLVINQLISEKGIRKEQILFLNFDDERLLFDAENFDEILQAYRELYPDISLKDVYMFFDEIQMAEDWQPFVRRVYEQECRHPLRTNGCQSSAICISSKNIYTSFKEISGYSSR